MSISTKIRRLKNGIRLVTIRNPALNSVVVLAGMKVGSRYEKPGIVGGAHFVEHVLFKGTERYPTSKDISSVIDSRGGEHNAYTDRDVTNFYVKMARPFGKEAVGIAHDMLCNPLFRTSDVNKERSVIQEEITNYENDPNQSAWALSDSKFYSDATMGRPITGGVQDVCFSADALRKFFRSYYVPSRTTVVLSGAVDAETADLAEGTFGTMVGRFEGEEHETVGIAAPSLSFKAGMTDKLHLVMRFPGAPGWTAESRKIHLLSMILGGYMSARLFQAVREKKGLCYGISSFPHEYVDVGSVNVATTIDKDKLQKMMRAVLREFRLLAKDGVTEGELESAKTCLTGQQMTSMDRPMGLAEDAAHQLNVVGTYEPPEERLKKYLSITKEEMDEAAKRYLDIGKLSVSVVGPRASGAQVHKLFKSMRD